MTEIEIWTKWESQIVNGLFPLRRFLGRSNHSVVFLSEYAGQNPCEAAIKLVPADPASADAQLWRWKRIAALSHPNLIRILDTGRCTLGGHPFLFVVTEYAEQTLAQLLTHRPLTGDEAREMLIPALAALGYLHRNHFVQAQFKPSNILVVKDQLKLASDTIRAAGGRWASGAEPSVYDPPEAQTGALDPAGDVWGLGVTLVEALTQTLPEWPHARSDAVSLPAALPPEFADMLGRCLSRNPALRPPIAQLEAQFSPAPQAAVPVVPQAANPVSAQSVPVETAPPRTGLLPALSQRPAAGRRLVPAIAVGLIVLLVIWAATRPFGGRTNAPLPASGAAAALSQQPAPHGSASHASAQTGTSPNSPASTSPAVVLHQEIPAVSRSALNSIHGQIKVSVLVTVDRSGSVVANSVENRGSSKYFARLATEAAKKWQFAPADLVSRQWLLQFGFSRAGAVVQAAPRVKRPVS
jgi:outer membrane biosynthesis protein TonB